VRVAGVLLIAMLVSVGCGATTGPTDRPPSISPTIGPSVIETIAPPASVGPPPSPTPDDGTTPLAIDPGLLDLLPADVAGAPVVEALDEATQAISDEALQGVASAIDAAVAVDTGSGNLVYALVVALRPAALSEAAFRDWRDSYDEGACADTGLGIGHAVQEIDGRTVYVGSCQSGTLTYHVLLEDGGILISAWSLGEGRFGELLVSNLRLEE
jgi:hypothetical protein